MAHSEEKLRTAYTRDKNRLMFDKRRTLMDAWSRYLAAPDWRRDIVAIQIG